MKNADDCVLAKWILDMLADKRGWKILISPKPFSDDAGSGLHHHIIMHDIKTKENVFYNKEFKGNLQNSDEWINKLSEVGKSFIAGNNSSLL